MTLRLAMWSGPRNISTAMMRAWENRPDCVVVDEPFYACYLAATGVEHPMREQVLASQSTDWSAVAQMLSTAPVDEAIFYQKHMTHHMLAETDLGWTRGLLHCFLIRDPLEVVNSYVRKRHQVSADDIGIIRQEQLYRAISEITRQDIPVIDAKAVLQDPETVLRALCDRLGMPFDAGMLHWPPGRRQSDGVWAAHWYESVEASTGFESYRARAISLTDEQRRVAEQSRSAYESLLEHQLS